MTDSMYELAFDRRTRGLPTIIVDVVAARGSVPRDIGTRMLVWSDGIAGTIGGGRLEWDAIARAREALRAGVVPADRRYALGASLGQCCGGSVTLRWRALDAASLANWPSPASSGALVQVYGAGHVGRAVVHVLATLDVRLQWIDERESAFPDQASPSNVERLCVEPVEAEVHAAPRNALYLVLTHQHDLDLRIVEAIVRRGDFAYLGLIGSTTKRRRFEHLLRERGIADDVLARIACPIGIEGIRGKEPAHIAVGVAAQLLPVIEAMSTSSSTSAMGHG